MFQEAKVPPMVLSLLGAKVRGNESTVTQPSNARDCGQVDARRSTADISPPQSAALDLHPVAQRLLLINRPRRDGTLSWRWYTAATGGIRIHDLAITSPAPYHSATAKQKYFLTGTTRL